MVGINCKLCCISAGRGMRQRGPDLTPAKSAARTAKQERLANALRENLRRRKEQGRAQQQEPTQPKAPDQEREPLA
jgi:hypothetical protein